MKSMSVIVRTITRLVYGFLLVFGLYVIAHGHLTPGGGFQGGAIVASGLALSLVAFGLSNLKGRVREGFLSAMESLGAISFISLALVGLGSTFFYNTLAGRGGLVFGERVLKGPNPGDMNTAGLIAPMNWAVGIKVLAGLGTVVYLMVLVGSLRDENEEETTGEGE